MSKKGVLIIVVCIYVFNLPPCFPAHHSENESDQLQADSQTLPGKGSTRQSVTNGDNSSWKEEFERICAQTDIATSLDAAQLRELIKDSEELMAMLREVEDPWAKVYIFRLENCKKFFVFALEWQESQ
jgi:hypothetical protein